MVIFLFPGFIIVLPFRRGFHCYGTSRKSKEAVIALGFDTVAPLSFPLLALSFSLAVRF